MVDLNEVAKAILAGCPAWLMKVDAKDVAALDAIQKRDMPGAQRVKVVRDWLHYYRVLRTYGDEEIVNTTAAIIQFADARTNTKLSGPEEILSEFKKLQAILQEVSPLIMAGGHRKVVSLTSKALWLCYPEDIPIFDGNAKRALQVLSRIAGVRAASCLKNDDYAAFIDVWFKLREKLSQSLVVPGCGLQPVRILDKFLWYLGQPAFEFDSASEPQEASLLS